MRKFGWLAVGLFTAIVINGCSSVDTKKVDENHYNLVSYYNEPPRTLSSSALREESKQVCPNGYEVLSKSAGKTGTFGIDDAQCAAYKNCDYALQWRIVCVDKPEEAFSIFGRK